MKNQYFADKHDFNKYDLLLRLMKCGLGLEQLGMMWWLTPNDPNRDDHHSHGNVRSYEVGGRDRELCEWLQKHHPRDMRDVRHLSKFRQIAQSDWRYREILDHVPANTAQRRVYAARVRQSACPRSLIFLDPDNGMMVPSARGERRRKYVDYSEVASILAAMDHKSLLVVYQHLPMEKREVFYPEKTQRLREEAGVEHITWASPDNLVTYWFLTKTADRLQQVEAAVEPYLVANGFLLP